MSGNLQVYSVCVNTSTSEALSDCEEAPWLQVSRFRAHVRFIHISHAHSAACPPPAPTPSLQSPGQQLLPSWPPALAKCWSTSLKVETFDSRSRVWEPLVHFMNCEQNVLNLLWGIANLLPQFLWNYCLNCWGFFYSKINRICLKTVQKIKKIRGQGREDNCWGIFQEMWFHQHNKNSLCVITGHTVTFLDTVHACRHNWSTKPVSDFHSTFQVMKHKISFSYVYILVILHPL